MKSGKIVVAAIAPRPLLVQGFNSGWFDAKGEWLSCRAASLLILVKHTRPKKLFNKLSCVRREVI